MGHAASPPTAPTACSCRPGENVPIICPWMNSTANILVAAMGAGTKLYGQDFGRGDPLTSWIIIVLGTALTAFGIVGPGADALWKNCGPDVDRDPLGRC